MDLVRSCYRTRIRPFKDSDAQTDIQWFFADKDADWLPFPTTFGSRNWMPDGEHWPAVGEVEGAQRAWRNGRAPRSFPADHLCGTEEQWREGALSTDPVPPHLEDGTLLCCFDGTESAGGITLGGSAKVGVKPRASGQITISGSAQPDSEIKIGGTITLDGTAPVYPAYAVLGGGPVVLGGTAPVARGVIGYGLIQITGEAPVSSVAFVVAHGGLTLGGSANFFSIAKGDTSDGITLYGSNPAFVKMPWPPPPGGIPWIDHNKPGWIWVPAPTPPVALGGSAVVVPRIIGTAGGAIVLSGTAPVSSVAFTKGTGGLVLGGTSRPTSIATGKASGTVQTGGTAPFTPVGTPTPPTIGGVATFAGLASSTFNTPPGMSAGDFMVLRVAYDPIGGSLPAMSGWSLFASGANSGIGWAIYTRLNPTLPDGPWTFNPGSHHAASITSWHGATALGGSDFINYNTSGNNPAPSIACDAGWIAIPFWVAFLSIQNSFTTPTGYTADGSTNSGGTSPIICCSPFHKGPLTAGTTGSPSGSWNTPTGNKVAIMVTLKP